MSKFRIVTAPKGFIVEREIAAALIGGIGTNISWKQASVVEDTLEIAKITLARLKAEDEFTPQVVYTDGE